MASTSFAGSTIETTAGYPSFVTVTLPSGKQIPNINGWGPNQYNSYATTLSPADAESLNSIQASADIIISGLQNQDQQAKTTTSSSTDTSAGTSTASAAGASTTNANAATQTNNTTVTNSTSSGVDPQTGLLTTGAGSATEIGSAYGYTAPASVASGSDPSVNVNGTSGGEAPLGTAVPATVGTGTNNADGNGSNTTSTNTPAGTNGGEAPLGTGVAAAPAGTGTGPAADIGAPSASATNPDNDWRIKLQLAQGAKYLYKTATDSSDILHPLNLTNGVIFPYMPSIQVGYKASYDSQELTHTNYKMHFYKNSSVDDITITCLLYTSPSPRD